MTEYYITQVEGTVNYFKVAKFSGDEQPENIYFVTLKRMPKNELPEMHCDCPNRRRGKHINDKHGQMVAKWIIAGKPVGFFDEKGEWHGSRPEGIEHSAATEGDQEPGAEDGEGDFSDDTV